MCFADHVDGNATNGGVDPLFPRFVPFYAGNSGQQIHANGWIADLDSDGSKAKVIERFETGFGVFGVCSNNAVQVARASRDSVQLALGGCGNIFAPGIGAPITAASEVQSFVTPMNQHRVSQGMDDLVWDDALANVARAHSQDMRGRSFFAHTNPDGDDPFDRMTAAGISYNAAGENIAYGYSTGGRVFDGWINSPGHLANIENSNYTHRGARYEEHGHYRTHVFAAESVGGVVFCMGSLLS